VQKKLVARKLENVKKTFLLGGERQRAAAGRSAPLVSFKEGSRVPHVGFKKAD